MNVGRMFHTILKNDTAIAALVAGADDVKKIGPFQAMQGVEGSKITYQIIDGGIVNTLDGDAGIRFPLFQVDCWGDSYDAVAAMGDALRSLVNDFEQVHTPGEIGTMWIQEHGEEFEEPAFDDDAGLFRVRIDVKTFVNEPEEI